MIIRKLINVVGILTVLFLLQPPAGAQGIAPVSLFEQCAELKAAGNGPDKISEAITTLQKKDEPARLAAIKLLGESCEKQAVQPLIDSLGDGSLAIRLAAIEGLGRLGDPESIEFLVEHCSEDSAEIRLGLVRTLISFKQLAARTSVVNGLINPGEKGVRNEADIRLRMIAILTLNELTSTAYNRKAILFIHEFQRATDQAIQKVIDEGLAALPATRNGTREIIGILKTSNAPVIRQWAVRLIGKLKLKEGRDALTETAANDRDPKVREAAAVVLKSLE